MSNSEIWFKRRSYGWGWTPANWKGWANLVIFVAALCAYPLYCEFTGEPLHVGYYLFFAAWLIAALIGLSFLKGEKPRWQWGNPKE